MRCRPLWDQLKLLRLAAQTCEGPVARLFWQATIEGAWFVDETAPEQPAALMSGCHAACCMSDRLCALLQGSWSKRREPR